MSPTGDLEIGAFAGVTAVGVVGDAHDTAHAHASRMTRRRTTIPRTFDVRSDGHLDVETEDNTAG
jgi:hypothetical protein